MEGAAGDPGDHGLPAFKRRQHEPRGPHLQNAWEQAIETVRANPYTLAKDISGIGFKTADQIAEKVGIPRESIIRACAGISHCLLEATNSGHCALPKEMLLDAAKGSCWLTRHSSARPWIGCL